MGIVITKLDNNNVEVTGKKQPYTLLGSMGVFRAESSASYKDGVSVQSEGKLMDFFTADNVDTVVRGDGTIVAISDADTLYSELKEFFFFEVGTSGGGGTPVSTSKVQIINQGNWSVGGTSGFFFDITHTLNTEVLLHDVYDITGGSNDGIELNEYLPQSNEVFRVESTINTIDVVVILSTGGESTVIDVIESGVVITGDYTLVPTDAGVRRDMNCPTTADITVDSGSLSDGESAYFTWVGVVQPVFVAGTATIEVDTFGSLKCRGQKATFGITRRGSIYEVIGKTE